MLFLILFPLNVHQISHTYLLAYEADWLPGRTPHQLQELLKNRYCWTEILSGVNKHVNSCSTCAHVKVPRTLPSGKLMPSPMPLRPWLHLALNFIMDLPQSEGMTTILVVLDRLLLFWHIGGYGEWSGAAVNLTDMEWIIGESNIGLSPPIQRSSSSAPFAHATKMIDLVPYHGLVWTKFTEVFRYSVSVCFGLTTATLSLERQPH